MQWGGSLGVLLALKTPSYLLLYYDPSCGSQGEERRGMHLFFSGMKTRLGAPLLSRWREAVSGNWEAFGLSTDIHSLLGTYCMPGPATHFCNRYGARMSHNSSGTGLCPLGLSHPEKAASCHARLAFRGRRTQGAWSGLIPGPPEQATSQFANGETEMGGEVAGPRLLR